MFDFSHLESSVAADTDVKSSASTLLTNLAQKVRDTAGDPAKAEALATALDESNAALAAAVVANTPADTPPV